MLVQGLEGRKTGVHQVQRRNTIDKEGGLASDRHDDARWQVGSDEDGSRLDRALLRRFPHAGKGLVMRLIRRGNVRINGKRAKPSSRLQAGCEVFVPASLRTPLEHASSVASAVRPHRLPEMRLLYEDAQLLVIDKPAGVVVHGGSGHNSGLIEQLKLARGLPELRLAHRLDRDTSGCLLLTKALPASRVVAEAFRAHQAQKTYLAWVMGHVEDHAARMVSSLAKGVVRGGERMVVDSSDGKEAVTDFQLMLRTEVQGVKLSLLALMPHHGRTHQLRVQLQQEGYAIAGDGKYGSAEDMRRFRAIGGRGMALHAWRLRLQHPLTGVDLDLRAPWPQRWQWI
ncbi:MAG: RluA family pseudouridine synthase [Mariprofundales bacterium]